MGKAVSPKFPSKQPGKGIVAFLSVAWDAVERVGSWVVTGLMGILVAVTTYQVFSRYILGRPLSWSEEFSRYVLVWLVFLGSWIAFKEGRHLAMDLVVHRLPDRIKAWISRMIDVIVLAFLGYITFVAAPDILEITARQTSAVLKVPMNYIYLALPVGAVLMIGEIVMGWLQPSRSSPGEAQLQSHSSTQPSDD